MRTSFTTLLLVPMLIPMLAAVPARAGAQQRPPVNETTAADRHDVINEKQHHYIGKVEMDDGRDTKLYADDVWFYVDENKAVATGNVVFRQGNNQISADRAEVDTKTGLGTFYNATGFATVKPPRQTVAPGGVALPPRAGEENVVLFFGETVEKIGPRKYKIVSGGFTTCVQPTPRWDMSADTIVLNLDHYTLLKQVVLNVKGVPLFYLPVLYYPTKREDRATGFLLPTYGTSTLQGHSIHNAFFWAINRSQDATIVHDWFSKTGQGVGTEYRYDFGGGSDGNFRAHLLNEHETPTNPADVRSYRLNGSANQLLPGRLRARARVDYFSSLQSNQKFNTDIADIAQSQRTFGGNVVGAWNSYSLNATIDRNEYFYNATSSAVMGSWPRVGVSRNERPIRRTPFYFSASGEYAGILSNQKAITGENDKSLQRFDFAPQFRFPFKKWQWFTVNSTLSWRDTYYSRSLDYREETTDDPPVIDKDLNRQFYTLQSQLTGPVFNRIWDTPDNGYAEKFKHSVEPYVTVGRTSFIDNANFIVKNESIDQTVGGDTQLTYGIANRFYAKRRSAVAGQPGQAREILTVDLRQSYHSNKQAVQYDTQYSTSNNGPADSNFAPINLNVRAQPTTQFNTTANVEIDSRYLALRQTSVSGGYSWSTQLQTTFSWSKRGFIPELDAFNDPDRVTQSLNGSATMRTRDNKYGSIYTFNYDVLNSTMINQKISGFYNAQCCGIALEFQNYNFGTTKERKFFMSFTLAGLGNFSPFNNALGGIPR